MGVHFIQCVGIRALSRLVISFLALRGAGTGFFAKVDALNGGDIDSGHPAEHDDSIGRRERGKKSPYPSVVKLTMEK